MRFYVRKRKQTPTIIVVALIDVLIVLLIYLMVTTTFKQQPALKLALPESNQAQKSGANEDAPLVVSIDPKGVFRVGLDAKPVTAERMKEEMLAAVSKTTNLNIAISAEKNEPFEQIIKVMDAAKDANIKVVNAFTKEAKP